MFLQDSFNEYTPPRSATPQPSTPSARGAGHGNSPASPPSNRHCSQYQTLMRDIQRIHSLNWPFISHFSLESLTRQHWRCSDHREEGYRQSNPTLIHLDIWALEIKMMRCVCSSTGRICFSRSSSIATTMPSQQSTTRR
ncbi:hypothetical protein VTJ04DRAFT_6764 [Mycothermus thermophilus]|uniref:uncharacterized protein n=1 Tax=Humicola insolens TaxID=85995 RepID=UPI0037430F38